MGANKRSFEQMRQDDINENLHEGVNMYFTPPNEEQEPQTGVTITTRSLQDLDKDGMDTMVKAVVDQVAQGNVDAMDNFLYFKKLEYLAKVGVENSKSYAYGKTYATKGNPYLRFGAKVEATATTSYDYSGCNDAELTRLETVEKEAKEALKARQKFLQALTKPITQLDEDTSEVNTINPAVKLQSEGYKVTL